MSQEGESIQAEQVVVPAPDSEIVPADDVENKNKATISDAIPITDKPVLVTGASGYLASEIIKQLLERGYKVRGTVRSISNDKVYRHLTGMAENFACPNSLELVEADLNDEATFVEAVSGCEYIMHVASPFTVNPTDPQKDLVDPAVNGNLYVLRAVKQANEKAAKGEGVRVKRVIQTSSVAAVCEAADPSHVYTRDDWNTDSSLEKNPYMFSKSLAEKAGWDFVEDPEIKDNPDLKFDYIAINPSGIVGPVTHPRHLQNTTVDTFRRFFDGTSPGVIKFSIEICDVRDVALAHIRAMEVESAKGRYIVNTNSYWMSEYIDMIKSNPEFADYIGHLPGFRMDGALGIGSTWLFTWFKKPGEGSFVRAHLNKQASFDSSPCQTELGMPPFIDGKETIHAVVKALIDGDLIKPTKKCSSSK